MDKKIAVKRLGVAAALGLVLVFQSTNAFARDRDDDRGREHDRGRSREVVVVGHQKYDYHNGRFYKPGLFFFNIALGIPPFGAVVHFLPEDHRVVVVGGSTYYYYDNVYYRPNLNGDYIVVPSPVAPVPAVQGLTGRRVTVNILNSDGSYTTVQLVQQRGGYVGPQGEFYPGNPTIEQLRTLYGR